MIIKIEDSIVHSWPLTNTTYYHSISLTHFLHPNNTEVLSQTLAKQLGTGLLTRKLSIGWSAKLCLSWGVIANNFYMQHVNNTVYILNKSHPNINIKLCLNWHIHTYPHCMTWLVVLALFLFTTKEIHLSVTSLILGWNATYIISCLIIELSRLKEKETILLINPTHSPHSIPISHHKLMSRPNAEGASNTHWQHNTFCVSHKVHYMMALWKLYIVCCLDVDIDLKIIILAIQSQICP